MPRIYPILSEWAQAAFDFSCWHTDEELADVYPWEDWILARSLVGMPAEGELETDMFAGIRASVSP
jgi:hypothetical protein